MIYIISFASGVINGIFASGAGQILVFYLVFVKKLDTHIGRATSLVCTSAATVVSILRYLNFIDVNFKELIIVIICGIVFGSLGAKLMNKIESNKLNLLSGVIITFFALYSLVFNR